MRDLARVAILALFVGGCVSADDDSQGAPAGVIPYACVDGAALVLLAFDEEPGRRGWGHFGGTHEPGESVAETAAREFREESNCAFAGPSAEDLALLVPSSSGGFVSFFAELRYQSISKISQDRPACPDVERSRWVWVRHADLVRALATDPPTKIDTVEGDVESIHLWPRAAGALQRAVEDGVLPDADPCPEPGV